MVGPEPDPKKFNIGFDSQDPEAMFIVVPVGEMARDKENGMALFIGKMREAEAVGSKCIKEKRMREAQGGIIKAPPGVIPMPTGRPN